MSEQERVVVADAVRRHRSARSIAAELGRSPVDDRAGVGANADPVTGEYHAHAAQRRMLERRPRPKQRRLDVDDKLRALPQRYLDRRWSPEQVAPTHDGVSRR